MNNVVSDRKKLDPITFEVLKNAFIMAVDQMTEQIFRTCYSFVIYAHDFSAALCDAEGNTVVQGSQDIAVHVGTLHFQCKAVIEYFGDDIHPGDVFMINDPYKGGTHFNDISFIRPLYADGRLLGFAQNKGHWADVGGKVPGSFDITAREMFGEGLRISPIKIMDKGVLRKDIADLLVANTRAPFMNTGDLHAQIEATSVCEREIERLIAKYGVDVIEQGMQQVQDWTAEVAGDIISELPDGEWEATDYLDNDPDGEEGMVPIHIKMKIKGNKVFYDLSESAPVVGTFLNSGYGATTSAVNAGTKFFFPQVPLNSGFYRVVDCELGPEGSVVNAGYPIAVTGYCSGVYEKVVSAIVEIWSKIMPERKMACSFNLEYLLIGGRDKRNGDDNFFMWYDWMAGGWGGRATKDGPNCTSPTFGVGLAIQSLEGQERLTPVLTTEHKLVRDSGGPGEFRGGCGVEKGGILLDVERSVMSYCCDRARSVTWGLEGGLPSLPHGVWLDKGKETEKFLGSVFSNVPVEKGTTFTRPSSGGGGMGDPLKRDIKLVLEDVLDDYVSVERAAKDYGVVLKEVNDANGLAVDEDATNKLRDEIKSKRHGWLKEDPESVAQRYRNKDLDVYDLLRQYGVIVDWGSGELLPETTRQFRELIDKRSAQYW